jgi:hypothetical protein
MHRSPQARTKAPPAVHGDGKAIKQFFDRFASALTHGDGKAIGEMFAYPAIAIGNDMSRSITTRDEVAQFFSSAPEQYRQRGIVDTRAEIQGIHWNTDRLATVDVVWPYLDEHGRVRGSESSTYVVHLEPGGEPKLQVMLMLGERPAS